MEFDKSRVYTALNAEEAPKDGLYILADDLNDLRNKVNGHKQKPIKIEIRPDNYNQRFVVQGTSIGWCLAYLVKLEENPIYIPWTKDNCPLRFGSELLLKDDKNEHVFVTGYNFNDRACNIYAYCWYNFAELFRIYTMPDGTPCGTVKVAE